MFQGVLSGTEFKKLYPNTKFFKLTNSNEIHNNFQFSDGINIDYLKFVPQTKCSGGLYFTEFNKIALWINYIDDITFIREVEILDDSRVSIEDHKFKTDKFYLKERILLSKFEFWNDVGFCVRSIQQNEFAAKYVKAIIDTINLEDIKCYPALIKMVEKQTFEMCFRAVQRNGCLLEHIHKKTPSLCLQAIQQTYEALRFVEQQTPEICMAAITKSANALEFVKEQTPEICIAAIERRIRYICLCPVNESENKSESESESKQTLEMCIASIKENQYALLGKNYQSVIEEISFLETCLAAIKQDQYALSIIKNQNIKICLDANANANQQQLTILECVRNQFRDMCIAAIKQF
jgi:hypothetical protein